MGIRKRPLSNPQDLKKLGKKIRVLRQALGISQETLADEAGIERSYMGAIERGERNPSFDKLGNIAKALKNHSLKTFGIATSSFFYLQTKYSFEKLVVTILDTLSRLMFISPSDSSTIDFTERNSVSIRNNSSRGILYVKSPFLSVEK